MTDAAAWVEWVPESTWVRVSSAVIIGIAASTIHWSGILLGGILVGLVPSSLSRALVAGAGFGLLVWFVGFVSLASAGIIPTMDALQIFGLSLAIPVVLGAVGASARELRPWVRQINPE